MTVSSLLPLFVLLPLLGAGLTLALWRHARAQRVITLVALAGVVVVASILLAVADDHTITASIGGWDAPIGISLVVDRFSALMLLVSAIVLLCVLVYSLAQGVADGDEEAPVAIYHPTYLVLAAGVFDAFLAGDLFNLYVAFEVLLAASYVLLTLSGTGERIRAGTIYVVVALVSSLIFLVAIAVAYAACGTVNMAQLASRLAGIDPGVALTIQLLLLTAFGIKAAVFPLSAWLPDSYPTAPAPVTAVFAGLLTKVGVYAIIRTQTLLFPSNQRVDTVLMWLALATMLIGILGAVAQDDIKRLLSFTLVSHIGYMVFGIALASDTGMAAAIFYVVHHITVQTTLFLVVGLVERRGGSTSLDRLGGLAKVAPGLAILFFIPAMNLAGIPPLSGFLGKLGLLEAGVATGTTLAWVLVAGSVVTSLLTLYALVKAWNKAFWRLPPPDLPKGVQLPRGMVGSAAALVVLGLSITVAGGPIYSYAERAARQLAPTAYIGAVLGDSGVAEYEAAVAGQTGEGASAGAGAGTAFERPTGGSAAVSEAVGSKGAS